MDNADRTRFSVGGAPYRPEIEWVSPDIDSEGGREDLDEATEAVSEEIPEEKQPDDDPSKPTGGTGSGETPADAFSHFEDSDRRSHGK